MVSTQSAMLFSATGFFPSAVLFLSDFKQDMEIMIVHF